MMLLVMHSVAASSKHTLHARSDMKTVDISSPLEAILDRGREPCFLPMRLSGRRRYSWPSLPRLYRCDRRRQAVMATAKVSVCSRLHT